MRVRSIIEIREKAVQDCTVFLSKASKLEQRHKMVK